MKAFFEAVGIIFGREELGTAEAEPAPKEGTTFFRWLFGREELPPPAVSIPPARTSFLRWIFVPEKLPEAPREGSGDQERPSLLKYLLSRETLPEDSVPEKPQRPRRSPERH